MNEWMQQYWTFYHAGVFIFLVAGLALIFRFLILRKRKTTWRNQAFFQTLERTFQQGF